MQFKVVCPNDSECDPVDAGSLIVGVVSDDGVPVFYLDYESALAIASRMIDAAATALAAGNLGASN